MRRRGHASAHRRWYVRSTDFPCAARRVFFFAAAAAAVALAMEARVLAMVLARRDTMLLLLLLLLTPKRSTSAVFMLRPVYNCCQHLFWRLRVNGSHGISALLLVSRLPCPEC